jgi:hypothetical protein
MQMMHETIYRALKEAGLDEIYEPQDYLNFFCLGNREVPDSTSTSNASNNPQVRLPVYLLVFHSRNNDVELLLLSLVYLASMLSDLKNFLFLAITDSHMVLLYHAEFVYVNKHYWELLCHIGYMKFV